MRYGTAVENVLCNAPFSLVVREW